MRTLRTAPALDAATWHAGHDASGRVRVELDGPGGDVRVTLAAGWRAAPGPERLGPAVVTALGAAVVARMTAWVQEGREVPPVPPADVPATEQAATVGAAQRELAVFRRRLAELRAAPTTVEGGPGVHVTVRDGRPATVQIDNLRRTDAELVEALAAGLRAALAAVSDQPAEALARCPALQAVLSTSRLALPFAL